MQGKYFKLILIVVAFSITFSFLLTYSFAQTCSENVCTVNRLISDSGAYKVSVRRWRKTTRKFHLPGTAWIGPLAGNGKRDWKHKNKARDTLIFVPHSIDFSKEVTLVMWLHGLGGFKLHSPRLGESLQALIQQDRNFILVAPEMPWSTNTSTPRTRQGYVWNGRKEENYAVFYNSTMKTIITNFHPDIKARVACREKGECQSPALFKNIIIGHSAGGSAVRMAARTKGLHMMSPDLIVYSDASYGRWADQTWRHYVKDHPECRYILLVRKWDKPHINALRLIKSVSREHRHRIEMKVFPRSWSHRLIGDRSMFMDIVWGERDAE